MKYVVVIGGSNIDYVATARDELREHDSNIGKLNISYGGVARNICDNLITQGLNVYFFTAIGNDSNGRDLVKDLESKGCIVKPYETNSLTSSYIAINNKDHDLKLAICDARTTEELPISFLKQYEDILLNAEYIVGDCNTKQVLEYITTLNKRIIIDGTSAIKVLRAKDYLDKLYALKVNKEEAVILTGVDDLKLAALNIHAKGVKEVIVTDGANDIVYVNDEKTNIIPCKKASNIVNSNGCGDAFIAGTVYGLMNDKKVIEAINDGMKLSEATLYSASAVLDKKVL